MVQDVGDNFFFAFENFYNEYFPGKEIFLIPIYIIFNNNMIYYLFKIIL